MIEIISLFFQGTIHSDNMAFLNEADLLIRLQRSFYLMCKAKYGDDYSVIGPKCKQMECLRLAANEDDIVACLPPPRKIKKQLLRARIAFTFRII